MMRRSIPIPALLLVAALLLGACDDSNGGNGSSETPEDETPVVTETPGPRPGSVELNVAEASAGEELVVSGEGWGTEPIDFYLVPGDAGTNTVSLIASGAAASLGEGTPNPDGTVEFRFTLAARYQPQNGEAINIAAGQQYVVAALQASRGTNTGPFTVR